MKIKTIDIDGFGVWNGLALADLSERATVVYGPNEAGKTTLMQFIRAMLYGFTPERRKRYLPPVHGGQPGGRLQVCNEFGTFTIHRQPNPAEPDDETGLLQIIDDRGEARDPSQLAGLVAGIDEPTYSNVFAVGLREIQELGSLDDTAAADYLYRLTSGLDRVSLVDVIREVEAARTRLLAADEKQPAQIVQLAARREQLQGQLEDLSRLARRWLDLAAQRTSLAEETQQLDQQIAQIEAASHVLRAALDVQGPWNLRADVQRQLEILKDVRPLPERAVEKLDTVNQRLAAGQKRLKQLGARRDQLKKDLQSLEVNKVLLSHAGRIESLHDQSQWILGLENQVARLRDEVSKLDAEIEAAVSGYRTAGAGSGSLDELPRETVSVLRRPAQVLREENDKLDKAKQEADEAKRALDSAIEQYEQVSRTKHLPDLNQAIQEAGTKVSLLRKRIQLEERIDQLGRRRQELEVDSQEIGAYDDAPLRVTALVGLFFAIGVMFVLIGTFGAWYGYVANGWPYAMFGFLVTGLSVFGKVLLERHSEEQVTDSFRQLEQLRIQLGEAKRERDELDAELPASAGALDARLREAEIELRDLERLIPIRTEREQAEQRHQAAQRRLADAQEAVKEARHRWKNALRSVGLPDDFAPPKVKQVVRSNEQVLELRRRRDARKDELDQRERELLVINNRLQQILDDVRHPCTSDQPIVRIRELIQAVAREKETLALREEVDKKLRKVARSRDKVIASLRKASRRRHALLTLAGVENEKGFRQAAADWARVVELKRQQAEQTLRIQTALAGHRAPLGPRPEGAPKGAAPSAAAAPAGFSEEQIAAVFQAHGRDIQGYWDEQQKQLAEIRARLAQLHERRGACAHEMQVLATDRSTGQVKRQLAGVERQLADCIRRWKILTVIATLLETVRLRYETDRQPQTLREASGYLARLTDGHYTRVWMPLDRRGLLVENDAGDSLPLDVLSRGTREAVFIGLRLALVTSFARRGAAVPLVLDDVLVNFDSDRVRCAAEVLCDFAAQGHQVLMFTCHEHITDIFEDARAEVRVLPSRDGKRRERRRRPAVVELPPPLPAPPPEEPSPVRTRPEADPNPLFQMAAADEPVYDPVHPLPERPARPEKPRRTKKKKPLELPDYWPLAELPASQPPPPPELELPDAWPLAEVSEPRRRVEPLRLDLPDSWPLAPLPAPSVPLVVEPVAAPYARPLPETFEVLAYRAVPESAAITITPLTGEAQAAPVATVILSPAEPTPPAPKRLASRRRRFTWESPEMYWEEQ